MMGWLGATMAFLDAHNGAVTAVATVFIAAFTIILAYVTRQQAKLATAAINLASETYVAAHRPRIVVLGFSLSGAANKEESFIIFSLYNRGDTSAKIIEVNLWFFYELEGETQFPAIQSVPALPVLIEAGHSVPWNAVLGLDYALVSSRTITQITLRGVIIYEDEKGRRRQTWTDRKYDFGDRRFRKINGSEFDFEG